MAFVMTARTLNFDPVHKVDLGPVDRENYRWTAFQHWSEREGWGDRVEFRRWRPNPENIYAPEVDRTEYRYPSGEDGVEKTEKEVYYLMNLPVPERPPITCGFM